MTRHYRRRRPGTRETIKAAAVAAGAAAGVAAVTFYLTRVFLSREPLPGPRDAPARDERPGESSKA